jgi:hypothetical protein
MKFSQAVASGSTDFFVASHIAAPKDFQVLKKTQSLHFIISPSIKSAL